MDTTISETSNDEDVATWCVWIAFHTDRSCLGRGRRLYPGARCELARESNAFGEGVLNDGRISRRHAVLEVDATHTLQVIDTGSSNGTHVNGQRVQQATLMPGDVVRVGSVLFVVRRAQSLEPPRTVYPLAGASALAAGCHRAVEAVLALRAPTLLVGERGALPGDVARWLHATVGGEMEEVSLDGWSDRLPDEWLHAMRRTDGGVIFATGLPIAGSEAERVLIETLATYRAGVTPWPLFGVATSASAPTTPTMDVRAATLGARLVQLPALRGRSEDLSLLAASWCDAHNRTWPLLGYREWLTLLRAPWPGDLQQFVALLDLAARAVDAGAPIDLDAWINRAASAVAQPLLATPAQASGAQTAIEVATDGSWFHMPSSGRVSLHRRPVLARLLAALVHARIDRPGAVLRVDHLVAQVWPGEKFVDGSGDNRLHVSLTHLRQLGLRTMIERIENGYRISPSVVIKRVGEQT